MKNWMIYGATGYSGKLIVEQAAKLGLQPIIAGRSKNKLKAIADKLALDYRVFSIDDLKDSQNPLDGIDVLLNCAGPFSATAKQMMSACIATQTDYIDITGEIDVFELAFELGSEAKKAGVVLCPGVGFDIIPTDCLAKKLSKLMPDASHLALGFDSKSGFSPGTAKTSIETLPKGGMIRANGILKKVPLAYKTRQLDFGAGEKLTMTIPWGDVSTAYRSTGIANTEVYIPASPNLVKKLKRMNFIRPLLGLGFVQNIMKKKIEKSVRGPSAEKRANQPTYLWGEVSNDKGETKTLKIQVANGYDVTTHGAIKVASFLLENRDFKGFYTPSLLIGDHLVDELPGTVQ
ncbi:MAG: saccharopine dehydrogenase NADP-binding domain-containing protein [Proteobacteria bacterium]|nr:saccharopine dehydrogenase NADP-binding domain-containing protein [Pseudomonadota bacterium]